MSELAGARAEILAAIGRAVSSPPPIDRAADYAAIARGYTRAGQLSAAARIALFVDRLEHYNVGVHQATATSLPARIGEVCGALAKKRMVVPAGLPASMLPADLELVPDLDLSYDDLDRLDGVVTLSTLAIAVTGTIVLTHSGGEGRRALTLIPDYHLCVVRAEQILETVPEALRMLAALEPALVTTISGPSATADIEMIRVRGVHGPRTLDVIVLEG